jgi:transposase
VSACVSCLGSSLERAFRAIKSVDLNVRPIHHRLPDRVTAHVFVAMLAYYVDLLHPRLQMH